MATAQTEATLPETEASSDLRQCLADANELKAEGNDYFRNGRWEDAISAYRSALVLLPNLERGTEHDAAPEGPSVSELDRECAKARAVLNANIGACYVSLGNHEEVVRACTEALRDDPLYVKALQRRATSNEKINSWSSLTQAQKDYLALEELLPPSSPKRPEVKRILHSLPSRIKEAEEHDKEEMLQKFKDLGNSILGKFGLSTNDFQLNPNGQGGYSLNMSR